MAEASKPPFPSPQEFLTQVPLYQKHLVTAENLEAALALVFFEGSYDSYCVVCGKPSTFHAAPAKNTLISKQVFEMNARGGKKLATFPMLLGVRHLVAGCARDALHSQDFLFRLAGGVHDGVATVRKIGQWPSFGICPFPSTTSTAVC